MAYRGARDSTRDGMGDGTKGSASDSTTCIHYDIGGKTLRGETSNLRTLRALERTSTERREMTPGSEILTGRTK
jgi:hypothetical protein